jgi:(R,R)-butanediol dehydrogenase / meso-butanediol dehydrogenase / diacetyl reductase
MGRPMCPRPAKPPRTDASPLTPPGSPAGTVVQTALHIRPASIRADRLALKDLTLAGTWCYPIQDFPRVAGLVASGRLPVERVISSVIPLESVVADGFERLVTRGTGEVKVLIEVAS